MKIKTIEHSPLPQFKSVKTTRLILNKQEWNTLVKAQKIVIQAEDMIFEYLKYLIPEKANNTFSLSDIDFDLSDNIRTLKYFIEEHGKDGIKIE